MTRGGGRPLVSVVVPLHNGAAYVAETLDSLERQSVDGLEVVVVDDGSSDEGPDVVTAHPVSARLVRQPRAGVAVARNRGVAEARGEWLTFLDQDDLWHPERLARMLDRIRSVSAPPLVATTHWTFAAATDRPVLEAAGTAVMVGRWLAPGRALQALVAADTEVRPRGDGRDHWVGVDQALTAPLSLTPTFVAQRAHLMACGLFPTHVRTLDDWWLTVTAARLAPILLVDEPTVYYRLHPRQTSTAAAIALPFLGSQLSLRYGGTVVTPADALTGRPQPRLPVNNVLEHQVGLLLATPEWRDDPRLRRAVTGMVEAVDPAGDLGQRLRSAVRRAEVKRRLPWLAAVPTRLRSRSVG